MGDELYPRSLQELEPWRKRLGVTVEEARKRLGEIVKCCG